MKGAMDWHLSKRVTDQQGKDRAYWIDEIAFLEARLNGSQGDIDSEDRAACEEALKACLLYTSPSPRDISGSRMPSSA